MAEITDYIARRLQARDRPAVLIGHSFGGRLVQNLLCRNLAAAAIATDPSPILGCGSCRSRHGSRLLRRWAIRSMTGVRCRLPKPSSVSVSPTPRRRPRPGRWTNAAPCRRRGACCYIRRQRRSTPRAATRVNAGTAHRELLLLMAGELDHPAPHVLVRSALRRYAKSSAVAKCKGFAARGHSLIIDSGWQELTEHSLAGLKSKPL